MKLGEQFECYLNNLGKALVRTCTQFLVDHRIHLAGHGHRGEEDPADLPQGRRHDHQHQGEGVRGLHDRRARRGRHLDDQDEDDHGPSVGQQQHDTIEQS